MVTREATALSAGFFAHASRLLKPYDSVRAAKLLWRAQRAWSYLEKNGGVDAAQSDLMYAALQLYLATGDESYHQRFRSSAARIVAGEGTWPEVYLAGNTSAKCSTSHFISYLLTDRPVDLDLGGALRS